ncbi:MAG: aminotransferase class V-fold PLP-dependent enzyme [Streptosporangiales bacterium]|nr:aminotransferase class V-fold PLP-dependent enzyme [Streptosporangiales bacterium]
MLERDDMREQLNVRAAFADVRGYLDTPSVGLPPLAATDRLREAVRGWETGTADYGDWERDAEECRAAFAAMLGVAPADVALVASIVPAVAAVASGLARRGGDVVAHRAEFRSLLLPFLAHVGEDRIRWVDGPYVAATFTAGIDAAADRGVAAVVCSSVSSHDGGRPDLPRVVDAADAYGAGVVVDATQSLGVAGLGIDATRLGAVFCAGYKGLLGPRGAAYAYVRPDLLEGPPPAPSPYGMADAPVVGAYGPPLAPRPGASGLDGSPAWLCWVGALPALRFLAEVPEEHREAHTVYLAERLRAGLAEAGFSAQDTDAAGPVVSVEAAEPSAVVAALREARVRAAARRGRVRFGFHLYNSTYDVERVLAVLRAPHQGAR